MKYFDEVHILQNDEKGGVIRGLARGRGASVFLDDKASVADEVKKSAPHVIVLQVAHHKSDTRSRKADKVVSNLREALGYIKPLATSH